jgi:predicted SnoaL-like aldol condensation-catalyzing enzyme
VPFAGGGFLHQKATASKVFFTASLLNRLIFKSTLVLQWRFPSGARGKKNRAKGVPDERDAVPCPTRRGAAGLEAMKHWDNLQEVAGKTVSGRSPIDGPTAVADLQKTEENRQLVQGFVNDVLLGKNAQKITDYIAPEKYDQHNPVVADGLDGLGKALTALAKAGMPMTYARNHRILGQGNFVLAQSEGTFLKKHVAFYDLFRVENGKIVEHWDTLEEIPAQENWKNDNGKS